eukprot:13020156-Alexandrium_andersonii.AAC.1
MCIRDSATTAGAASATAGGCLLRACIARTSVCQITEKHPPGASSRRRARAAPHSSRLWYCARREVVAEGTELSLIHI